MGGIPFLKMHGLGNDFVVLDGRHRRLAIDAPAARALADRHTGIGCDQVILLEPPDDPAATAAMQIRNADGSGAEACGNAARCVAWLLLRETGKARLRLETAGGVLEAAVLPDGRIAVDMGIPRTLWHEIPLARPMDTLRVELGCGALLTPVCTNIGNPHATFFVDDVAKIDLAALGPVLECDPLFAERANIGVAAVCGRDRIRLRVWERGTGITRACGSGACAALVAAHRRGLSDRRAVIALDGGNLDVDWREDRHVIMAGPAALSFEGSVDPGLLTTGLAP
jgi:diaminopimelate epimerase